MSNKKAKKINWTQLDNCLFTNTIEKIQRTKPNTEKKCVIHGNRDVCSIYDCNGIYRITSNAKFTYIT